MFLGKGGTFILHLSTSSVDVILFLKMILILLSAVLLESLWNGNCGTQEIVLSKDCRFQATFRNKTSRCHDSSLLNLWLPATNVKTFLTADILTCHSRRRADMQLKIQFAGFRGPNWFHSYGLWSLKTSTEGVGPLPRSPPGCTAMFQQAQLIRKYK